MMIAASQAQVQPRQGYFRNLVDSTVSGLRDGYARGYEWQTLRVYDAKKNQPQFQKDGMPVTIGQFCEQYPQYRRSAILVGVITGVAGTIAGLALGLVGKHF